MSADVVEPKAKVLQEEAPEFQHSDEILKNEDLMHEAFEGENHEHSMGVWEAAKSHPMACFWAFIMCFTIVMESFDMFLNTNFVALTHFKETFGVGPTGDKSIPTSWQSALFQSGQCGAFVGVYLAGPITNRIGYRWTTILGLVLMNATIFISFFANSLTVLVIGQAFEGVPWGFFIANSPAYASEVAPLPLRAAVTATLQMSWSIGSIIVAGVTYGTNNMDTKWEWRLPLALQWIFPTPLLILLLFAPESPWWLIRRGRKEEALRSIKRLGAKTEEDAQRSLAMIERTVRIEEQMGGKPTFLDLWKGTDRRRTIITCLIYASQNFAGNLIANQATFFFERRNFVQQSFPTQSDHHLPAIRRQCLLLGFHVVVQPSHGLPVGLWHQHCVPLHACHHRLCPPNPQHQLRPSLSWRHNLCCLCRHSGTYLIHLIDRS